MSSFIELTRDDGRTSLHNTSAIESVIPIEGGGAQVWFFNNEGLKAGMSYDEIKALLVSENH